jgi:glyoxylase-like metal-dependent hydrolase (beta-lactamase superfamily II)
MAQSSWDQSRAGCDIGEIKIDRVVDMERLTYPYERLLPNSDPKELRNLSAVMGSRLINPISLDLSLSFHSFLIRTHKLNILVDACCGNGKNRPNRLDWHRRDGPFLNNLAARGLVPEDIDIVMCTHLHADHVGWNTKMENGQWVPTFPKAEYLFSELEYKFWCDEQSKSSDPILQGSHLDSVLPIFDSGQAVLVDSNHHIGTGLNCEPAPGHTPGSVVLHVEDEGKEAFVCGDVMHHPAQVRHPDWSSSFCEDPGMSARYRRDLLGRVAGTGTLILPAHFLSPYYGPVEKNGDGFETVI